MDKQITETIAQGLKTALIQRFGFSDGEIQSVSATGQNSLTAAMKSYVLKNGSKEIESILLQESRFADSGLRVSIVKQLGVDLNQSLKMEADKSKELSEFSSDFLVKSITEAYQSSAHSKDLDGICDFIGIDKNLLKMVNSPAGKFFGKFF